MPVYVDNARIPYRGMLMCHMTADTHAELVAMADAIGVARKWIQFQDTPKEHFDICSTKRAKAVALGAVQVSSQDIVRRIREKSSGVRRPTRRPVQGLFEF